MPSPIEAMTMSEAVLSPNEIIDASSPLYLSETRCWSEQKYLKPAVVLRPKSVPALQRVVQALYDSQLDFAVRCNGVGSSSAEDVVLSMRAFNGFEFDPVAETITIGAGQTFGDVERKMEELAPGYAMLSARVPWVGVSGMTLTSGISWLSHEFGLAYDPQNLLDAQVVLRDGRVLWASAAPDLLWALRGGGGNFGVVTAFKLRVRRYPSNIFVGMIMYPNPAVEIVSKAVSDFVTRNKDPKIGMNVFVLTSQSKFFAAPTDSIGLMLYDANGLEHGRSEQGFKWALDIPGALDMTASMTLAQYNKLQG
ncbi:hypothetical protein MMC13_004621 [Lambiella insularis]|nr:hypothetical protein [Lambiella insularis]